MKQQINLQQDKNDLQQLRFDEDEDESESLVQEEDIVFQIIHRITILCNELFFLLLIRCQNVTLKIFQFHRFKFSSECHFGERIKKMNKFENCIL